MAGSVKTQEHRASILSLDGQTLDLESTLFSGQVFRWRKQGEWYEGVVSGHIVRVREVEGGIVFLTTLDDEDFMASQLRDYFSLGFDLSDVHFTLSKDSYLREIIGRYRGMRVLRQDPWETTLSFLCAQNSNVQRITRNVEDMCRSFGRPISFERTYSPHLSDAGGARRGRGGGAARTWTRLSSAVHRHPLPRRSQEAR